MKLPNWFRIAWWIAFLFIITSLMWLRHADLLTGKATAFDSLVFVIWVCLLLVPIFSEVKFLGFEFKQKVEELKNHIDKQVMALRSEIHNSVDFADSGAQGERDSGVNAKSVPG
jgi:amino acid permease